jgi:hypothetical protein
MDSSVIQIQDNVFHLLNVQIINLKDALEIMNVQETKFVNDHVVSMDVHLIINAHKVFYANLVDALYPFVIEMMIALEEIFVLEIDVLLVAVLSVIVTMDLYALKELAEDYLINHQDNVHLILIAGKMEFVLIFNVV